MTSAPDALSVRVDAIPTALAERAQWVVWRWERRDDRWTKFPINARTGRPARSTDPSTWSTIGEALAHAGANDLPGVGYVFSRDDPFTGIDFDGCRDPHTGELTADAEIVARLDSYTELSPSGTGVHVIVAATLPPGRRRTGALEMYSEGRFFTVTGHRLPGTPATVEPRQAALNAIHAEMFPAAPPRPPQPVTGSYPGSASLEDDELIERAMSARDGGKFAALWRGDTTGYPSPSEADMALCNVLAFWAGADPDRVDRLFQRSGLMRPKWDSRRGGQTYGEITVAKAVADCRETYTAPIRPTVRPNTQNATLVAGAPVATVTADDPAGTDDCQLEVLELRRKLARVERERDEARASLSMAIQVMLNPNITATEKVAVVALNGIVQHKRDTGQIEPDGTVIVSAAEVADDWRKAPDPGERVAPNNQSGTLPRMARDRVKPLLATAMERGLLSATPRTVVRTGPGGTAYRETTWAVAPATTAEFLAPAATWRPEEPVARKPRRVAVPCSSCGEVHPIIRTDVCGGCGTIRDRRTIEPGEVGDDLEAATPPTLPASDNLSDNVVGAPPPAWLPPMSDKLSEVPGTPPLEWSAQSAQKPGGRSTWDMDMTGRGWSP